jgi:WD40 repeat protein
LCGDQATSPDGQMVALFIGQDTGSLYLMKGTDAPTPVDDVEALSCLGGGTFQYSPDSARMGYIAFEPGAVQSEFPDGFLHIVNTADLSEAFTTENVVAFDMTNEGAAYVSFFTNDKGEADEAAVNWWSGSASVEVATLQPNSEDCKFTSAQIAVAASGNYVVILGHRCTKGDTRTAWQLYSVNPDERSATLAASDFQAGSYASFSRNNSIFLSPDGNRAYFTVSDGITANTVGLKMVDLADMSLVDVIERQMLVATYSGGANAFPQVSPNGSWLAFVVTSTNNDNTLQLLNLADPSVAPILIEAPSRGDTISSYSFTPDGSRLIAVVGGDNAADNSLVAVDLASGNDFRISRGRFGRSVVISPSGGEVAALDWKVLEDPKEPPYSTTVIINVDNSETATVYTGAEIVDGKVTNQTFIAPLVWRRAGGAAAATG